MLFRKAAAHAPDKSCYVGRGRILAADGRMSQSSPPRSYTHSSFQCNLGFTIQAAVSEVFSISKTQRFCLKAVLSRMIALWRCGVRVTAHRALRPSLLAMPCMQGTRIKEERNPVPASQPTQNPRALPRKGMDFSNLCPPCRPRPRVPSV